VNGNETLSSAVVIHVQVLNHDSRPTEKLIHFCCGKPIGGKLLNFACGGTHNLTEFSTLGGKRDAAQPAVIRIGCALNEPIALYAPQGDRHLPHRLRRIALVHAAALADQNDLIKTFLPT
jgi:hypothetical protein